ncbi:unnamed protein product [Brachionus calyciflorus]|uniref:Acyl carrier protein n=1 Tax=Brachionus calyciflorus TaxID=104777 RepID=A0A813M2Z1_9BILA|nr:unnamed protein product [Brachionus calyciflorus]
MNSVFKSSRYLARALNIQNLIRSSSNIGLIKSQNRTFSSQILNSNSSKLFLTQITKKNLESLRSYSHVPYTRDMIEQRVLFVLKMCDKVDVNKLSLKSHFNKDLGLDSLDQVDIVIAMEDEFGFEIPDEDGEFLMTPADVVQYVCDKYDVFD